MWPNPWHLKHLLMLMRLGLGLAGGGWLFCGAGVLCGLDGKGFIGLRGGLELPLLKGVFRIKGLEFRGLKDCLAFFCYSTL